MPNREMGSRTTQVFLGLLMLIIGMSALFSENAIAILIGVIGLIVLARQLNTTRVNSLGEQRYEAEDTYDRELVPRVDDVPPPHPRADQVYSHALASIKAAGLDPDTVHVLPIDIGVMAFTGDQNPVIYRTKPVFDNVDYIQPFVQLRLPTRAVGRIRFEIVDSDGQILFIHEDLHQLQRGRNLITPAARLPIHDAQAMSGGWELRISADGVLLSVHRFRWQESTDRVIRRHLHDDGEISSEMRAMMADSRLQKISLDDLLAAQEDEMRSQGGQRQS
jgi:hypothetical protein